MVANLLNRFDFNYFRCRKLPKALKEWPAFIELKRKIDDFNESCPLLEMMSNKAMLERHWKRLEELTKYSFDLESDTFQLRNIMEAPLLKFREDIEVRFRVGDSVLYQRFSVIRIFASVL